jgi:hypothetical protein
MLIAGDDATSESQDLGKKALLQVFDGYATLCKDVLDRRPGDVQMLGELNGVWDQALEHWTPEHTDPQEWHLDLAIRRGDGEAEIRPSLGKALSS